MSNSSQRAFVGTRFAWLLCAGVAAASLFLALFVSHPRQPAGVFRYETAMAARWPDLWVFSVHGVPPPTFFDLQDILWSREIAAQGRDVYVEPPMMDAPYVYGYPKGWLTFARLGLDRTDTRVVGLTWAALFLIAAVAAVRPSTPVRLIWLVAGLFAPPALECLAMANNDLVLFALFVLAAWLWQRRTAGGAGAVGVLFLAGWLKIHPAVTVLGLIDGTRRTLLVVVATILALAALFAVNLRDLHYVSQNTPRPHVHAVGHRVLPDRLLDGATRHPETMAWFDRFGGYALWHRALPPAVSAGFLALIGLCALRGLKASSRSPTPSDDDAFDETLFRFAACLHLSSFAIGNNWLHREVFLLLAGPWLLASGSRLWLAGLIVWAWWLGGMERGALFGITQIVTWVITGALAYYLAKSLAAPLRASLPQPLARWLPGAAPGGA